MERRRKRNYKGNGVGTFTAKVIRLANMVEYREKTVASRTILGKKTGSLTLFSFDRGQGLNAHTVPFNAMIYLIDGQAEVAISGKTMRLKAGDMIIMPANEPHSLKSADRFKIALTAIRLG